MSGYDLSIFPEIQDGRYVTVTISGNREGLLLLAKMISEVAMTDQDTMKGLQVGDHYHIHLHPEDHLSISSCEVQIRRSDPKLA